MFWILCSYHQAEKHPPIKTFQSKQMFFFLTSLDMIVRYLISAKVAGGQEKLGEKSQATQATMMLQLQC